MPGVEVDWKMTERNYDLLVDIFKDILIVEKRGACGFWFVPWGELVTWLGVEESLTYTVTYRSPRTINTIEDKGGLFYATKKMGKT